MDITKIDITLENNLMPVIGIVYLSYLALRTMTLLFYFGVPKAAVNSGHDNTFVIFVRTSIIFITVLLMFYTIEKKTAGNFLYLTAVCLILIFIISEIFAEFCIHIIFPILMSISPSSQMNLKIHKLFFSDGEDNGELKKENTNIGFSVMANIVAAVFTFCSIA